MSVPKLQDLDLLITLAQHGSLQEAARTHGMSLSTMSRRLAALEQALGTHLVHRSHAGSALTPAGQQLVERARPLTGELHAMMQGLAAVDGAMAGTVSLTVLEGALAMTLGAIHSFRLRHPRVSFKLDLSNRFLDMSRNEVDLALRTMPPSAQGLVTHKVGGSRASVYGGTGRFKALPMERRLEALRQQESIVLGGELAGLPETQWLKAHTAFVALEVPTMASLLDATRRGLGVAILPDELAAADAGFVRLYAGADLPHREIWLVMHERSAEIYRVKAFADHLLGELAPQFSAHP